MRLFHWNKSATPPPGVPAPPVTTAMANDNKERVIYWEEDSSKPNLPRKYIMPGTELSTGAPVTNQPVFKSQEIPVQPSQPPLPAPPPTIRNPFVDSDVKMPVTQPAPTQPTPTQPAPTQPPASSPFVSPTPSSTLEKPPFLQPRLERNIKAPFTGKQTDSPEPTTAQPPPPPLPAPANSLQSTQGAPSLAPRPINPSEAVGPTTRPPFLPTNPPASRVQDPPWTRR